MNRKLSVDRVRTVQQIYFKENIMKIKTDILKYKQMKKLAAMQPNPVMQNIQVVAQQIIVKQNTPQVTQEKPIQVVAQQIIVKQSKPQVIQEKPIQVVLEPAIKIDPVIENPEVDTPDTSDSIQLQIKSEISNQTNQTIKPRTPSKPKKTKK